jgi:hypothetical protein
VVIPMAGLRLEIVPKWAVHFQMFVAFRPVLHCLGRLDLAVSTIVPKVNFLLASDFPNSMCHT